MSKIQIANLQATGSELFAGTDSFLTELQSTEAHAIYGGKGSGGHGKGSGGHGKGSGGYGKGSGGYGKGSGGHGKGSGGYGYPCW
jgi:hypothetical protein